MGGEARADHPDSPCVVSDEGVSEAGKNSSEEGMGRPDEKLSEGLATLQGDNGVLELQQHLEDIQNFHKTLLAYHMQNADGDSGDSLMPPFPTNDALLRSCNTSMLNQLKDPSVHCAPLGRKWKSSLPSELRPSGGTKTRKQSSHLHLLKSLYTSSLCEDVWDGSDTNRGSNVSRQGRETEIDQEVSETNRDVVLLNSCKRSKSSTQKGVQRVMDTTQYFVSTMEQDFADNMLVGLGASTSKRLALGCTSVALSVHSLPASRVFLLPDVRMRAETRWALERCRESHLVPPGPRRKSSDTSSFQPSPLDSFRDPFFDTLYFSIATGLAHDRDDTFSTETGICSNPAANNPRLAYYVTISPETLMLCKLKNMLWTRLGSNQIVKKVTLKDRLTRKVETLLRRFSAYQKSSSCISGLFSKSAENEMRALTTSLVEVFSVTKKASRRNKVIRPKTIKPDSSAGTCPLLKIPPHHVTPSIFNESGLSPRTSNTTRNDDNGESKPSSTKQTPFFPFIKSNKLKVDTIGAFEIWGCGIYPHNCNELLLAQIRPEMDLNSIILSPTLSMLDKDFVCNTLPDSEKTHFDCKYDIHANLESDEGSNKVGLTDIRSNDITSNAEQSNTNGSSKVMDLEKKLARFLLSVSETCSYVDAVGNPDYCSSGRQTARSCETLHDLCSYRYVWEKSKERLEIFLTEVLDLSGKLEEGSNLHREVIMLVKELDHLTRETTALSQIRDALDKIICRIKDRIQSRYLRRATPQSDNSILGASPPHNSFLANSTVSTSAVEDTAPITQNTIVAQGSAPLVQADSQTAAVTGLKQQLNQLLTLVSGLKHVIERTLELEASKQAVQEGEQNCQSQIAHEIEEPTGKTSEETAFLKEDYRICSPQDKTASLTNKVNRFCIKRMLDGSRHRLVCFKSNPNYASKTHKGYTFATNSSANSAKSTNMYMKTVQTSNMCTNDSGMIHNHNISRSGLGKFIVRELQTGRSRPSFPTSYPSEIVVRTSAWERYNAGTFAKVLLAFLLFDVGRSSYMIVLSIFVLHVHGFLDPLFDFISATSHTQPFSVTLNDLRNRAALIQQVNQARRIQAGRPQPARAEDALSFREGHMTSHREEDIRGPFSSETGTNVEIAGAEGSLRERATHSILSSKVKATDIECSAHGAKLDVIDSTLAVGKQAGDEEIGALELLQRITEPVGEGPPSVGGVSSSIERQDPYTQGLPATAEDIAVAGEGVESEGLSAESMPLATEQTQGIRKGGADSGCQTLYPEAQKNSTEELGFPDAILNSPERETHEPGAPRFHGPNTKKETSRRDNASGIAILQGGVEGKLEGSVRADEKAERPLGEAIERTMSEITGVASRNIDGGGVERRQNNVANALASDVTMLENVLARNDDPTEPPYLHRFLYQSIFVFVMTMLPWWNPDPAYLT